MFLAKTSALTVVEPYFRNIRVASKLGQKALKEGYAFSPAFSFPTTKEELDCYIQKNRKSLVEVYRRVEPSAQLLIRYLYDADSEVDEYDKRTHPNYPENFLAKFSEVEKLIRAFLTSLLDSNLCENSVLNTHQKSLQGANTPSAKISNVAISSSSSNEDLSSFETPRTDQAETRSKNEKNKESQTISLEWDSEKFLQLSGVTSTTSEILSSKLKEGETIDTITTNYTEKAMKRHPEDVLMMMAEFEKLKKQEKVDELIETLEEMKKNLEMRLQELDITQSMNDSAFAEHIANRTTNEDTSITYADLDRKFFMGHITNMRPLYDNIRKAKQITISKKTKQFTPYPPTKPRDADLTSEDDQDATPRSSRPKERERLKNLKPANKTEEIQEEQLSDTLSLHSFPRDHSPTSTIEQPRANQSGGSGRQSQGTDSNKVRALELDVITLTEQVRAYAARLEESRTPQRTRESNRDTYHTPHYLPKIEIPTFSGKIEDFPRFWETFTTIIDSQDWPEIAKFSYLITKLDKDAASIIKMIPVTAAGYPMAKEKLKSTYLNPHLLEVALERKMDSIHRAKENSESLLQTVCDVESIIELKKAYKTHLDHTSLIRRIVNMFPFKMTEKALRDPAAKKDVESFIKHIKSQIEDKRLYELLVQQTDNSVLFTKTSSTAGRCAFCKGTHLSQKCRKFTSVTERVKIIRDKDLCFSCLSASHTSRNCKSAPCSVCNKPHHASICRSYSNNEKYNTRHSERKYDSHRNRSPHKHSYRKNDFRSKSPYQSRSNSRNSYRDNKKYRSKSPYSERSQSRESYRSDNSRYNSRERNNSRDRNNRRDQTPYRRNDRRHNSRSSSREVKRTLRVSDNRSRTNLMIFEAHVQTKKGEETIYGILDTGADCSFITERLAKKIDAEHTTTKRISIATFGNKEEPYETKLIDNFTLFNNHDERLTIPISTFPEIIDNVTPVNLDKADMKFVIKYSINLPRFLQKPFIEIDILIGLDNFHEVYRNGSNSFKLPSGLMISPTFFGNMVYGSAHTTHRSMISVTRTIRVRNLMTQVHELDSDKDDELDIEKMWNLESIKIFDNISKTQEEEKVLQNFISTVSKEKDGIHVGLPWKVKESDFASNYHIALARLRQLSNQMRVKTPDLWQKYNDLIDEQLKSGIIEEVEDWKDHPGHYGPVYYMPHRAVIKHTSRTTKIRIVMDASSKAKNELSLNDAVHQGPCILPNIAGVLLRSRCGKNLITADIEKAFHQIHLNEIDRDATRFLVPIKINLPVNENNVKALRHTRPAFGINASPFLLAGGIYYGLDLIATEKTAKMIAEIKKNLYVDNLILPFDESNVGTSIYKKSKSLFSQLNMNLREYSCSNMVTQSNINANDKCEGDEVKLLGIDSNVKQDAFRMKMNLGDIDETLTKRRILQAAHSTYDPLGFLTPLFIKPRHFIQKLWAHDYHWDSPLNSHHIKEWEEIHSSIHGYKVQMRRSIGSQRILTSKSDNQTLNVFVDASKIAFAAVAYITYEDEHDNITSEFLMAKHRLAPRNKTLKQLKDVLTIPRLELTSMVLGVKLAGFILEQTNFGIKRINMFGDSSIALSWLISDKSNGVFVDNRTREIILNMNHIRKCHGIPTHFYHVATDHNAADLATRGLDKRSFDVYKWFHGPSFLTEAIHNNFDHIPYIKPFLFKPHLEMSVLKIKIVYHDNEILNYENRSYKNSINIVAYVLRFIRKCRPNKRTRCLEFFDEVPQTNEGTYYNIQPSSLERKLAENCIIKDIQKHIDKRDTKYKHLELFEDAEGMIRLYGRLNNLPNKLEANPVLLPEYHPFTLSILKHLHFSFLHFGANFIKSEFRRCFWTTRLTKQIVSCIRNCWVCKKLNNRPYKYPQMAQLPQDRLKRSAPFEHIGIDLAGPFRVREKDSTVVNRYIALFTCFTTRAIHLETLESTSAADFGLSYRKFIARRGVPKTILSDNASNFTATKVTLEDIRKSNNSPWNSTKWEFITPLSPWKGGMYERMIGLVKKALKSTLKLPCSISIFDTVVTEAEAIINMRPLSAVVDSVQDYNPVRPIDLLSPGSCFTTLDFDPSADHVPTVKTHEDLVNSMHEIRVRLDTMWNRWYTDYILNLREKHIKSMKQGRSSSSTPKVGSVVLMADEKVPRNQWKLAVITSLHPATSPRSAQLRTVNTTHLTQRNTFKNKTMIRSVNCLVPLEITDDSTTSNDFTPEVSIQEHAAPEPIETIPYENNLTSTSLAETIDSPIIEDNLPLLFPSAITTTAAHPENHCSTPDLIQLDSDNLPLLFPSDVSTTTAQLENHCSTPNLIQLDSDDDHDPQDDSNDIQHTDNIQIETIETPQTPNRDNAPTTANDTNQDIIYEGFKPHNGPLRSHRLPRQAHKAVSFANLLKTAILISIISLVIPLTTASPIVYCTKGGLAIFPNSNDTHVTVCATDKFCITHEGNKNFTALMPADIAIHPYNLNVRMTTPLTEPHVFQIQCPAAPFCDMINCIFCSSLITNPECWPRAAVSTTAIMFWLILFSTISILCLMKKLLQFLRKIITNILLFVWTSLARCIPAHSLSKTISKNNSSINISMQNWKRSRIPIVIALALVLVSPTSACNALYLGESQSIHCSNTSDSSSCNLSEQVQLSMNTLHSDSCFLLGNSSRYIHLKVLETRLTCEKNTILYTKNTTTFFRSKKRCPSMGSCSGDFCQQVQTSDHIPELHLVNKYPGNSYCLDSCGFISCGCGLPSEGCLFYRIYQVPEKDLYELFECNQWIPTIKFELSYPNNNITVREKFAASPYITFASSPLNFTITHFSFNPDLQMNKRFITQADQSKLMATVPDTYRFSYICTSAENCTSNNLCSCHASDSQINCDSPQNDVHQLFSQSHTLPLVRPSGYFIHNKHKNTPVFLPYTYNIQLLLNFNLAHIKFGQDNTWASNVVLTSSPLSGCYHCPEGASVNITCFSEKERDPVVLRCQEQSVVIHCSPQNTTNSPKLYLDTADASITCTYMSNSQSKRLVLSGHLQFSRPLLESSNSYHISAYKNSFVLPDIHFILSIYESIYLFSIAIFLLSFLLVSCIFTIIERILPLHSIPLFSSLPFLAISIISLPGKVLFATIALSLRIMRRLLNLCIILFSPPSGPSKPDSKTL